MKRFAPSMVPGFPSRDNSYDLGCYVSVPNSNFHGVWGLLHLDWLKAVDPWYILAREI